MPKCRPEGRAISEPPKEEKEEEEEEEEEEKASFHGAARRAVHRAAVITSAIGVTCRAARRKSPRSLFTLIADDGHYRVTRDARLARAHPSSFRNAFPLALPDSFPSFAARSDSRPTRRSDQRTRVTRARNNSGR